MKVMEGHKMIKRLINVETQLNEVDLKRICIYVIYLICHSLHLNTVGKVGMVNFILDENLSI